MPAATSGAAATSVRAQTPPVAETGTISVRVSELSTDAPLAGVEVAARLVSPCDPSQQTMPAVDGFSVILDATTDASGVARFEDVSVGCWTVAATPPDGYVAEPSRVRSAFLAKAGDHFDAAIQLQKGQGDPCSGAELSRATGLDTINLGYCDGEFAQVSKACGPSESCPNGPGDVSLILRRQSGVWATYATLPTAMCLSAAQSDGVPAELAHNFNPNC